MIFGGENDVGIQIKVENGIAYFRPAMTETDDVVKLHDRGSSHSENARGGSEMFLKGGSRRNELVMALQNPHGPYFVLERDTHGWFKAIPFVPSHKPAKKTLSVAPPKNAPHIRVWRNRVTKKAPVLTRNLVELVNRANQKNPAPVSYKAAKNLVAEYQRYDRAGRPLREVSRAKKIIASFETSGGDVNAAMALQLPTVATTVTPSTSRAKGSVSEQNIIARQQQMIETQKEQLESLSKLVLSMAGKKLTPDDLAML